MTGMPRLPIGCAARGTGQSAPRALPGRGRSSTTAVPSLSRSCPFPSLPPPVLSLSFPVPSWSCLVPVPSLSRPGPVSSLFRPDPVPTLSCPSPVLLPSLSRAFSCPVPPLSLSCPVSVPSHPGPTVVPSRRCPDPSPSRPVLVPSHRSLSHPCPARPVPSLRLSGVPVPGSRGFSRPHLPGEARVSGNKPRLVPAGAPSLLLPSCWRGHPRPTTESAASSPPGLIVPVLGVRNTPKPCPCSARAGRGLSCLPGEPGVTTHTPETKKKKKPKNHPFAWEKPRICWLHHCRIWPVKTPESIIIFLSFP